MVLSKKSRRTAETRDDDEDDDDDDDEEEEEEKPRKRRSKRPSEDGRSFARDAYPDIFQKRVWCRELTRLVLEEFQIAPIQTLESLAKATSTREKDLQVVLDVLASTPLVDKCTTEGSAEVRKRRGRDGQ